MVPVEAHRYLREQWCGTFCDHTPGVETRNTELVSWPQSQTLVSLAGKMAFVCHTMPDSRSSHGGTHRTGGDGFHPNEEAHTLVEVPDHLISSHTRGGYEGET